jgi:hypothetical protein
MNGATGRVLRGNPRGRPQSASSAARASLLTALLAAAAIAAGCTATHPAQPNSPTPAADRSDATFFDALRGQQLGVVFAALGHPDGVRPVADSVGAYVVAWRRVWTVRDPGGAPARDACIVLGAVTRQGVVSDIFVDGDVAACARSFHEGT